MIYAMHNAVIMPVKTAFVLFFVMNSLSNLFGIGGGSLISRLLGEGRYDDAKKVCSFSFYGTIGITIIYSFVCFIFIVNNEY